MSQGSANDIILTGLPRSGTTLCCRLLNSLPDAVALHEPMHAASLSKLSQRKAMLSEIEAFFAATRRRIASEGWVPSKALDGVIPDNQFSDQRDPGTGKRLRHQKLSNAGIRVDKPLGDDHALVIKQPAIFTALIETLAPRFPVYAVIRNPVAVLGSWNSLDISLSRGRLPPAESLCPELAESLNGMGNALERQVFLLNWFFEQYDHHLPRSSIIYYERVVASGGAELGRMIPSAGTLAQELQNKNDNPLYDHGRKKHWTDALLAADGACWRFYSKDSGRPFENNQKRGSAV